jgi:hypothetical protein
MSIRVSFLPPYDGQTLQPVRQIQVYDFAMHLCWFLSWKILFYYCYKVLKAAMLGLFLNTTRDFEGKLSHHVVSI